jgi:hypothetical protein
LKYLTDDIDLTALHLGGSYHYGLDARTDLWGGVTVEYQEFDFDRGSVNDAALGLRGDLDYVGFTGTPRYAIKRDFKLFAELDVYDSELGIIGGVSLDL